MNIQELLKWEDKYEFTKYPKEVYEELVIMQRPCQNRMIVMGAWKTACICLGTSNLAYISLTGAHYSFNDRWDSEKSTYVTKEAWELISKNEIQIQTHIPNEFTAFEPKILTNLRSIRGIGFVYAAFVLHCMKPDVFPLVDQHVLRAFSNITSSNGNSYFELEANWENYYKYNEFMKDCKKQISIDYWRFDRALWAYGKWLKMNYKASDISYEIVKDINLTKMWNRSLSTDTIPEIKKDIKGKGKWAQSQTLGKQKTFFWRFDNNGNLKIFREMKPAALESTILKSDLEKINNYLSLDKWTHLANNVEKLGDMTEKEGLGSYLVFELGYSPGEGQLASHLAALHCIAKIWESNGKQRGMMFRKRSDNWRGFLENLYIELTS